METFPASGRMERLRRVLNQEADEERKRHTKDVRKKFQERFKEIQQEQERERASQQKRKVPVSTCNPIVYTAWVIGHFQKYHNTLCLSFKILHKHCFLFFFFLLGPL